MGSLARKRKRQQVKENLKCCGHKMKRIGVSKGPDQDDAPIFLCRHCGKTMKGN